MLQNFDYLNWVAIGVAALAYFILGALWYSKVLFVKRWIADLKIDVNNPDAKKGMGMMFGGSFVMMLVQCLALAILAERLGIRGGEAGGWMSGIKLGAFCGACFSAASVWVNYLYEKNRSAFFSSMEAMQ
ncbi:MAG: DUF1761 domain-containing protein [Chitinophagaceae bacterium]|nr:DUF1761 domain-containing protein [Chitinophagaceae bacterium]